MRIQHVFMYEITARQWDPVSYADSSCVLNVPEDRFKMWSMTNFDWLSGKVKFLTM